MNRRERERIRRGRENEDRVYSRIKKRVKVEEREDGRVKLVDKDQRREEGWNKKWIAEKKCVDSIGRGNEVGGKDRLFMESSD